MAWTPEIEGAALEMYRRAGIDPAQPEGIVTLAERLLGPGCVQEHGGLRNTAALVRQDRLIFVKRGLSPQALAFAVAHELGHYALAMPHIHGGEMESECDAFAGALCVPRPALQRALGFVGRDLEALSAGFVATQSVVALRLGEVTGSPLALVTPRAVRVRGDAWGWPADPAEIRRIARGPHPELRRIDLTDASRRLVLVAA